VSMKYVRATYQVPAKRGARVRYEWPDGVPREGTIVGSKDQYIKVRLDGDEHWGLYHPTWKMTYL
jgi:hypothetical protein